MLDTEDSPNHTAIYDRLTLRYLQCASYLHASILSTFPFKWLPELFFIFGIVFFSLLINSLMNTASERLKYLMRKLLTEQIIKLYFQVHMKPEELMKMLPVKCSHKRPTLGSSVLPFNI